jgi:NitT/TauT family transport system substrate-binding protein
MSKNLTKSTRWILPLVAGVLLAGCGPKKPETPETRAAKANEPVTLRLAFFPNVTHAVALVGTGNGTFAKALGSKVKIEEQSYNAGPAEIEALFGDQVDIGYIGPGPAVNGFLKSHGKALQIIAGASSGGAGLVVRSDSGITDVKGLAGKHVSSPQTGGTQDISLRHALQVAGLSSTDKGGTVSVVPVTNPDTLTLFKKKELDAAWVPEPWVARLVKEGGGTVLSDERDLWPNKQFATTVVIVRRKFLDEHPEVVAKFLAAHVETVDWIQKNKDAAKALVGQRIQKLTGKALAADILTNALSRTDITYDPLKETVLTFADWSKALGFQREDRGALGDLFNLKPLNDALGQKKLAHIQ